MVNSLAIDERAVGAADVLHGEAIRAADDAGMPPRNLRVSEHEIIAHAAADSKLIVLKLDLSGGDRPAFHDEKRL